MLFQRKINRAMKWSRDQKLRAEGRDPEQEELDRELKNKGKGKWKEEPLPSMEELKEEANQVQLEKGDLFAMIFSALITIVPICLGLLLLICLLGYLLIFGWQLL